MSADGEQPRTKVGEVLVDVRVLKEWVAHGEVWVVAHVDGLGAVMYHWPIDDLMGVPLR